MIGTYIGGKFCTKLNPWGNLLNHIQHNKYIVFLISFCDMLILWKKAMSSSKKTKLGDALIWGYHMAKSPSILLTCKSTWVFITHWRTAPFFGLLLA